MFGVRLEDRSHVYDYPDRHNTNPAQNADVHLDDQQAYVACGAVPEHCQPEMSHLVLLQCSGTAQQGVYDIGNLCTSSCASEINSLLADASSRNAQSSSRAR
jgi:hypothetical protein